MGVQAIQWAKTSVRQINEFSASKYCKTGTGIHNTSGFFVTLSWGEEVIRNFLKEAFAEDFIWEWITSDIFLREFIELTEGSFGV